MEQLARFKPDSVTSRPQENFRLITSGQALLTDLRAEAAQLTSGQRLLIKGMVMADGEAMDQIIGLTLKAAKKGAQPHLVCDPISLYATGELPSYLVSALPSIPGVAAIEQLKLKKDTNAAMFADLAEDPTVKFEFSPSPSITRRFFPLSGADHAKGIIVNDSVLYLGNLNYDDDSFFNRAGFTFKITDPAIAKPVALELAQPKDSSKPDYKEQLTTETTLIVDTGKPGRSEIYKSAVEAVDQAQDHVNLALTHLPNGELLESLIRALRRGLAVDIATTKAGNLTGLHSYVIQRLNEKKFRRLKIRPIVHFTSGKNRSKGLVTDQVALWGSHNLVEEGIVLGTREIALKTTNEVARANLEAFYSSQS